MYHGSIVSHPSSPRRRTYPSRVSGHRYHRHVSQTPSTKNKNPLVSHNSYPIIDTWRFVGPHVAVLCCWVLGSFYCNTNKCILGPCSKKEYIYAPVDAIMNFSQQIGLARISMRRKSPKGILFGCGCNVGPRLRHNVCSKRGAVS